MIILDFPTQQITLQKIEFKPGDKIFLKHIRKTSNLSDCNLSSYPFTKEKGRQNKISKFNFGG